MCPPNHMNSLLRGLWLPAVHYCGLFRLCFQQKIYHRLLLFVTFCVCFPNGWRLRNFKGNGVFCGAESIDAERFPIVFLSFVLITLWTAWLMASPLKRQWEGVAGEKQAPELQCPPQLFGKHDLVSFPTEVSTQMQANVCTNTIKGIVHPKTQV